MIYKERSTCLVNSSILPLTPLFWSAASLRLHLQFKTTSKKKLNQLQNPSKRIHFSSSSPVVHSSLCGAALLRVFRNSGRHSIPILLPIHDPPVSDFHNRRMPDLYLNSIEFESNRNLNRDQSATDTKNDNNNHNHNHNNNNNNSISISIEPSDPSTASSSFPSSIDSHHLLLPLPASTDPSNSTSPISFASCSSSSSAEPPHFSSSASSSSTAFYSSYNSSPRNVSPITIPYSLTLSQTSYQSSLGQLLKPSIMNPLTNSPLFWNSPSPAPAGTTLLHPSSSASASASSLRPPSSSSNPLYSLFSPQPSTTREGGNGASGGGSTGKKLQFLQMATESVIQNNNGNHSSSMVSQSVPSQTQLHQPHAHLSQHHQLNQPLLFEDSNSLHSIPPPSPSHLISRPSPHRSLAPSPSSQLLRPFAVVSSVSPSVSPSPTAEQSSSNSALVTSQHQELQSSTRSAFLPRSPFKPSHLLNSNNHSSNNQEPTLSLTSTPIQFGFHNPTHSSSSTSLIFSSHGMSRRPSNSFTPSASPARFIPVANDGSADTLFSSPLVFGSSQTAPSPSPPIPQFHSSA